jgi:ferric-chelate reductase [NAD(P)H]
MAADFNQKAFENLSYGLYIVTSRNENRLNGQIVNTVIQVTSQPPRVAVIINKKNLTHEYICHSRVFGVSVLEQAAPMTFFGPFGFRSGRDYDKFSKVEFREGTAGCPLITQYSLSILESKVFEQIDLGTHTIFMGDVVTSEVLKEGTALTYLYYKQNLKGKSSPLSPTYNPNR